MFRDYCSSDKSAFPEYKRMKIQYDKGELEAPSTMLLMAPKCSEIAHLSDLVALSMILEWTGLDCIRLKQINVILH